jgi:hypothetical protein
MMDTQIVYGQIIDVLPDSVEILCRLSDLDEPAYLEVRRFLRGFVEGAVNLQVNVFCKITITLETGKQITEIEQIDDDISSYFIKEDIFAELEGSPFSTKQIRE